MFVSLYYTISGYQQTGSLGAKSVVQLYTIMLVHINYIFKYKYCIFEFRNIIQNVVEFISLFMDIKCSHIFAFLPSSEIYPVILSGSNK